MALNIIDISFQTCLNADLDAEAGLPKPKQTEGMILLVVDDPQAVYIYHDGAWIAWTL
jgi:hypothetical protein